MKATSPLLGFNNNFRHRGRLYHIQTEDSGVKHPHVITHLFVDGGRILKSIKTSYAHILGQDAMSDTVRQMMKEQHKAMIIALRDGHFDDGGNFEVALPQNDIFAGSTNPGSEMRARITSMPPTVPDMAAVAPADLRDALTSDSPDAIAEEAASYRQSRQSSPDPLPAPPPVFQRSRTAPSEHPVQNGRYSMTRPASIFATSKPSNDSIFGEDLLSQRSLDEVILSYLVEDSEGSEKK